MSKKIYKFSEETRKKMSESHKGKIGYWKGRKRPPFSQEWKENPIR